MALTYDTKSRIPATVLTTSTGVTLAGNHTCGANAQVLVVMLCWGGTGARGGSAPTYNGVALTQAASKQSVTETSVEFWYMLAPPVGQSLEVSVPNPNAYSMWVYIASGNAASGYTCVFDSSGVAATTSASPTVSVTTVATGCFIFAVVATGDNTFAPTARTGTSLYEEDITLPTTIGGGAQYYVKSGSGAQSMTWTEATSDDYGAIAVAFKEQKLPVSMAGTVSTNTSITGVVRRLRRVLGQASATVIATGSLAVHGIKLCTGQSNPSVLVSGVLRSSKRIAGQSGVTSLAASPLRVVRKLAGLSNTTASATITLSRTRGLAGLVATAGSASGNLVKVGGGQAQPLVGISSVTSSVSGTLKIAKALTLWTDLWRTVIVVKMSGAAAAQSGATGFLNHVLLKGTTHGWSQTHGGLSGLPRPLVGTVTVQSGASGTIIVNEVLFEGVSNAQCIVTGVLSGLPRRHGVVVVVVSTANGTMTVSKTFAGIVSVQSGTNGRLFEPYEMQLTIRTAYIQPTFAHNIRLNADLKCRREVFHLVY